MPLKPTTLHREDKRKTTSMRLVPIGSSFNVSLKSLCIRNLTPK